MDTTDFLTKENRDYFQDRPVYKAMINSFRRKMLPLYHKTLSDDYLERHYASGELSDIYYIQGYRENKPTY